MFVPTKKEATAAKRILMTKSKEIRVETKRTNY